jgi:hypothetical protein
VQFATEVGLAQAAAVLVQTASVLHVHAAEPAVPVHVWRVLGQATAVPYVQQPASPWVHDARLPLTHAVWLCEQVLWHVVEHVAFGAFPPQTSEVGHDASAAT